MKRPTFFWACLFLASTSLTAGCKNGDDPMCRLDDADSCDSDRRCIATGPHVNECAPSCDPWASAPGCAADAICVPLGDGDAACIAECDPAEDLCGEGWRCAPAGGRGNICRAECDPAAGECGPDEVCQPLDDGGVCTPPCLENDNLACPDPQFCEQRVDGFAACYDPIRVVGRVVELGTANGIANARVSAADETGAASSNGATTNTEGGYTLGVSVEREINGAPAAGSTFTLRAGAQDYELFPRGVRVALPIDAGALAVEGSGGWVVENTATDIGLIALRGAARGHGSIAGHVLADNPGPGGTLVVAAGAGIAPIGWADRSGEYVVFNTPPGSYEVRGYKAFLQFDPEPVTVGAGENLNDINLVERDEIATSTVSGSVSLVNPGDCEGTSVVLVPEETFDAFFARGEIPVGLRAPTPGVDPDVTGTWSIEGVPDGEYAVLAGFENDRCVRDPDPEISGTQVLHITVPNTDDGSRDIDTGSSFKVTGALAVFFPGATEPEVVSEPLTFRWEDDSSEDTYHIVVYDAFGEEIWRRDDLDGVSGDEPSVLYTGPTLESGMLYQFRVTSLRRGGTAPISTTEDLLGVFEVR